MKKFSLITIFTSLGISLLFSISTLASVGQKGIKNGDTYNKSVSYLENSTYDFKVFTPTSEQVEEFEENENIIGVFPFYKSKAEILLSGKANSNDVIAIFSDPKYDIELTEFNNSRLIKKNDSNDNQPKIFIDNKTAETSGAKIGDLVNIRLKGKRDIAFKITRIYEDFSFYNEPTIFFYYSSDIKAVIDEGIETPRKIEGAYLKANSVSVLDVYLKTNYIPLGALLPFNNEYFSSKFEYDEYVKNFKIEYLGESIFSRQVNLNIALENNKYFLAEATASANLTYLLMFFATTIASLKVLFGLKNRKKIEQKTGSLNQRRSYLLTYLGTDLAVGLISVIVIFVNKFLNSGSSIAYLTRLTTTSLIIIGIGTFINISISFLSTYLPSLKSLKKDN